MCDKVTLCEQSHDSKDEHIVEAFLEQVLWVKWASVGVNFDLI